MMVLGLVKKCHEHLCQLEVIADNVVEFWEAAELYNLQKLKGFVYRFLAVNWSSRQDIPGLKELESKRGDYHGNFIAFLMENWNEFTIIKMRNTTP